MSRNSEVLKDFTEYCEKHPTERFWQALRNWAAVENWLVFTPRLRDEHHDTFYWEEKSY